MRLRNRMNRATCLLLLIICCHLIVGCTPQTAISAAETIPIETDTPEDQPTNIAKNQQGFQIELKSLTRQEGQIRAEFCFLLPTSDDWQIGLRPNDVLMVSGDMMSASDRGGLVNLAQAQGAERCIYRLFQAAGWESSARISIIIQKIETSALEIPDCVKAQEKLNRKLIPIKINCWAGDHSSGYDIIEKPATMSMEKARELAYYEGLVDVIWGPWEFKTGFFDSPANLK